MECDKYQMLKFYYIYCKKNQNIMSAIGPFGNNLFN